MVEFTLAGLHSITRTILTDSSLKLKVYVRLALSCCSSNMDLSLLTVSAQEFKAVKGLVFCGEPSLETNVLVYRRDGVTTFYPKHIDLPGGTQANQGAEI